MSDNTSSPVSPPPDVLIRSDGSTSSSELSFSSSGSEPRQQNLVTLDQNNVSIDSSCKQAMPPVREYDPKKTYGIQSFRGTPTVLRQQRDSLTSMFERFLEQQSQNPEDATANCGIIFMSGASPLTFALEEAQGDNNAIKTALHDAGSRFPKGDGTKTIEGDIHPSHLSLQDIAYLKDKGAFERPKGDVSDAMVAAFIESSILCTLSMI
jgi:hypothetical protein